MTHFVMAESSTDSYFMRACFPQKVTHLPLDKMAAILADVIFRCIFVNEKICMLIEISLKFVPKGPSDNNQALV